MWQILASLAGIILTLIAAVNIIYYISILKAIKESSPTKYAETNPRTKITVVIPTYKEELAIEGKLVNLIEQTYPLDLIETIVIDSNSQDKTTMIVKEFMQNHPELNIKLIEEDRRLGKSRAINKAFSLACPQSEIVMMTDADVYLEKDAIKRLVSRFEDQKIGAVCGREVLINPEESRGTKIEAIYRSFYEKLRIGESYIDSTPFFEGQCGAYRAKVIRGENIRENSNADDCQLAIIVRRKGYVSICDEKAVFYEYSPPDGGSQRLQKVRRGQGLARLFWYNKDILFNKKYGKFGCMIMPANFFMHIVSPLLVLSIPAIFLVSFFYYLFQGGDFTYGLVPLIIGCAILVIAYFVTGKKYLGIAWTFLEYQLILFWGIILILGGKSLHKWQKVDIIREKCSQRNELPPI